MILRKIYPAFTAFIILSSTLCFTQETVPEESPASSAENAAAEGHSPAEEIASEENLEEDYSQDSIPEGFVIIPEKKRTVINIKGADHELTQKFKQQFMTKSGQKLLTNTLYDSIPYRPYIRSMLKKNKMPMFLQYLPVIESNYRSNAVSRSGATGLWQFMANSMYPFLKKNSWYDERLDPWKETEAALKKLQDNYVMFKSWPEALAAYNMGAGALRRIMKANPGKDFWDLAEAKLLPSQTIHYVPKLIAAADIVENAEYYGLLEISIADKLIEDAPAPCYDYVTVAGMISLEQISQLSEIRRETLDFLNPSLIRKCTPAGEKYLLRVPSGTEEKVKNALNNADIATDAWVHIVVAGDSLWGISRRYGISIADICAANAISEGGILSIDQKIIIPVFN